MSDELNQKLLAFCAQEFKRGEGRQCVNLELIHCQPGFRGDTIREWSKADHPEVFEDLTKLDDFVSSIAEIAEQEADSYGKGDHRFQLVSRQYLGGKTRCTFKVAASFSAAGDGNSDDAVLALSTDGSTGTAPSGPASAFLAIIGQQMRHNERHMQTNHQMFAGSLAVLARTNESQADEIRALRAERAQMLKDLEASRVDQDTRELAAIRQVAADERKDKILAKVLPLTSVVASKLIGGAAAGGGGGLEILLNELAASLSPQQLQRIAGALHPTQQVLLAEAIRMAKEKAPPEEPAKPKEDTPTADEKKTG